MRSRIGLLFVGVILVAQVAARAAGGPVAVSPGTEGGVSQVESRCPTFNWAGVPGASSYELVVYLVGGGGEEAKPLLRQTVPGTANGWTPSLGRCLERGRQYAWSVRAVGRKSAPDWSPPRLFEVASGPGSAEFEEALAVVQAYLESAGARARSRVRGALSSVPTGVEEDTLEPEPSGASARAPEPHLLTTPDAIGVKSEVADTAGVTFGIHGISNSVGDGSVGVVGESTATSGQTVGVLGEVASLLGVAGEFRLPSNQGTLLRGVSQGVEVFRVNANGDTFVGDHLWITRHLSDDRRIYFDPSGTERLQWSQNSQRFEFSDDLILEGVLGAGTSAAVGFNAFGGTNTNSGDMSSRGDVYVEDDLEVDGVLHVDGGYGCGVYSVASVCPIGNVDTGPNCNDVPVGSFCEADGECSLGQGIDNCGTNDWYFRLE